MEEKILNGKCLYTPAGAAREYAAVGCNFYRGCPYQCDYCYNRKGWTSKVMGIDHAVLESKFTNNKTRPKKYSHLTAEQYAVFVFKSEVDKNLDYLRQAGIFYSFSTDPMCPDCMYLTVTTALYAISKGIPVRILTKNADWGDNTLTRQLSELSQKDKELLSFGFTLTGRDDREPFASSNKRRLAMIRKLYEEGFPTFASLEPVIDFESSYRMIEQSLGFCKFYMIGLMSHYKDYYKDMSAFTAKVFLERIFMLQQLTGFKVYYKESIRKYYDSILYELYDTSDSDVIRPVSTIYQSLTPLSYISRCHNAFMNINKHVATLYFYEYLRPEDEQYDKFCLWLLFTLYADTDMLYDSYDSIILSTSSLYAPEVEKTYQTLLSLETECRMFKNSLMALKQIMTEFGTVNHEKRDLLPWLKILADQVLEASISLRQDLEKQRNVWKSLNQQV